MSKYLSLLLLIFLSISNLFSYSHLYLNLPCNQPSQYQENVDSPNLHSTNHYNFHHNKTVDLTIINALQPIAIAQLYTSMSNQELFEAYHLYVNQNHLHYIRKLPGYDDFIVHLHKKIRCFFIDEVSRQEGIDEAFASLDRNEFTQKSEANYLRSKAQIEAFNAHINTTQAKLRAMQWDQLLEKGVELGTTIILDTVALQAIGNFASHASRALVSNLSDAMSSAAAQEYLVEAAGVGKIALEDGSDAVHRAIDTIIKHPEAIKSEASITNTIKKINSSSLIVEQGGKFSASEERAAEYMCKIGNQVALRTPQGTRAAGGTSDLLVNGINYDVYTPTTSNLNRIITAIADKKTQALGIVLDLSQTSVTAEQLGDVMARLVGKGAGSIKEVIILK